MSLVELVIYGILGLGTSILSGITGGGGGFIMTPLLIFFGLSPAEAVSTGKINGLAVTVGSLHGLRKYKDFSKPLVAIAMVLAFAVGLVSPYFITRLDQEVYKKILGVILLLLIPVIRVKKLGIKKTKTSNVFLVVGWPLLVIALLLQGIFSGGLGALVSLVLIGFLGLDGISANIVKRYSQLLLNSVIIISVFSSGLIVWQVAIVGICTSLSGGMIGSRLALKKGNKLIMDVFTVMIIFSATWLLI
jgi:uncharacterized protein